MKTLKFLVDDGEYKAGDVAVLGDKDADAKLYDRIAELFEGEAPEPASEPEAEAAEEPAEEVEPEASEEAEPE
jgi:hypothetical protein